MTQYQQAKLDARIAMFKGAKGREQEVIQMFEKVIELAPTVKAKEKAEKDLKVVKGILSEFIIQEV